MSMMMFQEQLRDHYRFPRNRKELQDADFTSFDDNPSCGDRVQFQGKMENDLVTTLCFTGTGCILSQATASMLVEVCEGKSVDFILSFSKEKLCELVGVTLGPNRIKCAMLPLLVLQEGVRQVSSQLLQGLK